VWTEASSSWYKPLTNSCEQDNAGNFLTSWINTYLPKYRTTPNHKHQYGRCFHFVHDYKVIYHCSDDDLRKNYCVIFTVNMVLLFRDWLCFMVLCSWKVTYRKYGMTLMAKTSYSLDSKRKMCGDWNNKLLWNIVMGNLWAWKPL